MTNNQERLARLKARLEEERQNLVEYAALGWHGAWSQTKESIRKRERLIAALEADQAAAKAVQP